MLLESIGGQYCAVQTFGGATDNTSVHGASAVCALPIDWGPVLYIGLHRRSSLQQAPPELPL